MLQTHTTKLKKKKKGKHPFQNPKLKKESILEKKNHLNLLTMEDTIVIRDKQLFDDDELSVTIIIKSKITKNKRTQSSKIQI